jgi:acetyl-CoA carboxylase/biotin carboxylase 1
LVAYQQPLFVYIPPFSELRGGAWVVVDSTINADCMEFYAAEDARGGVLEATGAVAIKFREKDLKLAAHRLDPDLISMDARLATLKAAAPQDATEIAELTKQIVHRERLLLGVYQQVAVHFGDLHDTPGRMKRKGVIRRQVNWVESRAYFFWRLQRRLAEFDIAKTIGKMKATTASDEGEEKSLQQTHPKLAAAALLKNWFLESGGSEDAWDGDDRMAVKWLEDNAALVKSKLAGLRKVAAAGAMAHTFQQLLRLGEEGGEAGSRTVADALRAALASLGQENAAAVMAGMQELV